MADTQLSCLIKKRQRVCALILWALTALTDWRAWLCVSFSQVVFLKVYLAPKVLTKLRQEWDKCTFLALGTNEPNTDWLIALHFCQRQLKDNNSNWRWALPANWHDRVNSFPLGEREWHGRGTSKVAQVAGAGASIQWSLIDERKHIDTSEREVTGIIIIQLHAHFTTAPAKAGIDSSDCADDWSACSIVLRKVEKSKDTVKCMLKTSSTSLPLSVSPIIIYLDNVCVCVCVCVYVCKKSESVIWQWSINSRIDVTFLDWMHQ